MFSPLIYQFESSLKVAGVSEEAALSANIDESMEK